MKKEDFSEQDVHRLYDAALARQKVYAGPRKSLGSIIRLAIEGGYRLQVAASPRAPLDVGGAFDLNAAVPLYSPAGMERRTFVGPAVGDAHLFPLNALSLFVALGGVGKTTTVIAIASHIAAGKTWGKSELVRRRVLVFFIEESQDELNRKFGATVHSWSDQERLRAQENLRLISCLERDARLTSIIGRQVEATRVGEHVISAAIEFDAELIVLDHLQGFVSGDLNNSDTATALTREANMIVAATGAAVVLTAHIAKGNIKAQEVLDGVTTGSLAFENAARQVTGAIPISDDDAQKFGLLRARDEYLMLGMPKNNYGPARSKSYLHKLHVPKFHTITVEPFEPAPPVPIRSGSERVKEALLAYVSCHPGTSPNKLDELAGKNGQFKATRQLVRSMLLDLQNDGVLIVRKPTKEERVSLRLRHQVHSIYECVE